MSTTATNTGPRLGGAGVNPGQGRAGKVRPPSPTKHRRTGLIGLAVLLIVGSAAIAGLLAVRLDSRSAVLVAGRPMEIGHLITKEDLSETRVASEGLDLFAASESDQVIGKYAAQAMPSGRLLDAKMLQTQGFLKAGLVAVGISVTPGRIPASGLQAGDRVQVIKTSDGTVLVASAVVSTAPADKSSGGIGGIISDGSSQSSGSVATLVVTAEDGPKVAAASAANGLALLLMERGKQLGG